MGEVQMQGAPNARHLSQPSAMLMAEREPQTDEVKRWSGADHGHDRTLDAAKYLI